jgi:hypothetical protein
MEHSAVGRERPPGLPAGQDVVDQDGAQLVVDSSR